MIQTTIKDIIIGMLAMAIVSFIVGFCFGYIWKLIEIEKRGKP